MVFDYWMAANFILYSQFFRFCFKTSFPEILTLLSFACLSLDRGRYLLERILIINMPFHILSYSRVGNRREAFICFFNSFSALWLKSLKMQWDESQQFRSRVRDTPMIHRTSHAKFMLHQWCNFLKFTGFVIFDVLVVAGGGCPLSPCANDIFSSRIFH
jgi:hypothetical protein